MEYITKEGLEKLKQELEVLKNVKRREVAARLQNAAAQGDLSENFDYSDAKEEMEFVERRIAELEAFLLSATVVSETRTGNTVEVGSRVSLNGPDGFSLDIVITGPREADPLSGKISSESPLGNALLGKKKGDSVAVETPGGKAAYTIKAIE
ncbi:MAG: transcription elongation factor GreA [Candidatus Yanofskybacteria bacterium]|nr:transcription elongation factor GreA [Candidatus Yanofskybacteria bacterium]